MNDYFYTGPHLLSFYHRDPYKRRFLRCNQPVCRREKLRGCDLWFVELTWAESALTDYASKAVT